MTSLGANTSYPRNFVALLLRAKRTLGQENSIEAHATPAEPPAYNTKVPGCRAHHLLAISRRDKLKQATIKVGNARLLKLAEFLEALPRKRFDYGVWVGDDWKGAKDLSCGTTACALGWATAMPEFRRLGLTLTYDSVRDEKAIGAGTVFWEAEGPYAATRIFRLSLEESRFLFIPNRDEDLGSPPKTATPKQVAKHIRKFVAVRS